MALSDKQISRYAKKAAAPADVPSTSPSTWPALLLHLAALASLTNSFRLLFEPSPMSEFFETQKGGHWSFLTVLGCAKSLCVALGGVADAPVMTHAHVFSLGASWLTFVVAIAKDLFPGVKVFDYLKSALSIVTVPAEGIITILYWGLQSINPDLLTPRDAAFHIPLFLDISLHFLPALFLWTDFLLFSPRMSKSTNPLLISAVTTLAYTSWMEYTSAYNKRFPYPFLNQLTPPYRAAFYVSMIPVLLSLFYLANGVHRVVRGKDSGRPVDPISEKKIK